MAQISQQQIVTAAPHQVVKLSRAEMNAWEMTRSALLWQCPAFTHIFYTMMCHGEEVALFCKDIPIAATDGKVIMLNPEPFFKLTMNERVFALAHEICHGMFHHCILMRGFQRSGVVVTRAGKKLDYSHELMNIAMDLVINDLLIESGVGKFNADWLHDKKMGTSVDSVIDVYEKLYKAQKKNGGKGQGNGTGVGGNSFDQHLPPGAATGKDPAKAESEHSQVEWDTAIAGAIAAAKAQGKLPAAMERSFGKMLNPEVSWEEKIQAWFARKVGFGSYDWRRPDRALIVRDIYAPGRSGYGCDTIVIGGDTSGSMGQPEFDRIFAEMRGILGDLRPKRIIILWCDAKVHKADYVEEAEDMNGLKPLGGGGTDFRPVFDWIEENGIEPDALVYFTDGWGGFPSEAPKYPVLWGAVQPGVTYPFGEVVDVPVKAQAD